MEARDENREYATSIVTRPTRVGVNVIENTYEKPYDSERFSKSLARAVVITLYTRLAATTGGRDSCLCAVFFFVVVSQRTRVVGFGRRVHLDAVAESRSMQRETSRPDADKRTSGYNDTLRRLKRVIIA